MHEISGDGSRDFNLFSLRGLKRLMSKQIYDNAKIVVIAMYFDYGD